MIFFSNKINSIEKNTFFKIMSETKQILFKRYFLWNNKVHFQAKISNNVYLNVVITLFKPKSFMKIGRCNEEKK